MLNSANVAPGFSAAATLTALARLLFFLFFVNGNRVEVLRLKDVSAVEAPYVIDTVPPVEELGSLVLTSLHSEITPILD